MLFRSQLGLALAGEVVFHGQRVVDGRELGRELNVQDRADDLNDFAGVHNTSVKTNVGQEAGAISRKRPKPP